MSDMTLQNRKVNIDFSHARIDWNPSGPEFSHLFNAFSALAPSLEPFLVRAMQRAAKELPADTPPEQRADIEMFNVQESRHSRMHAQFNKVLYAAGYDLAGAEQKLKADYDRYLNSKGLKFSLAYSEGFETLGPAIAGYFFDRSPELMEQWDEPSTFLWLWHVSEEYEHRAVVNGTYKLLYDDYWYRIYGLWYALIHIFSFVLKQSNRMISYDLAHGRITGKWRSRRRQVTTLLGFARYAMPRILFVCHRRSYDPTNYPPISSAQLILARTSEKYGIADPPALKESV